MSEQPRPMCLCQLSGAPIVRIVQEITQTADGKSPGMARVSKVAGIAFRFAPQGLAGRFTIRPPTSPPSGAAGLWWRSSPVGERCHDPNHQAAHV